MSVSIVRISGLLSILLSVEVNCGFWDIFSSQQPIPEPTQAVLGPIWRVHRYHGIDLTPLNTPQAPSWPAEVTSLATILGLDPSTIPPADEVMDLLGVSSPAAALETIREISRTPEGIDAMRSFLESRVPAHQSVPQLQHLPQLPPLHLPAASEIQSVAVPPLRSAPIQPQPITIHRAKNIEQLQMALTHGQKVEAVNALTTSGTTAPL